MNNINKCLYGSMREIADMLSYANIELSTDDTKALLTNICQRIDFLEKQAVNAALTAGQIDGLMELVAETRNLLADHQSDQEAHKP